MPKIERVRVMYGRQSKDGKQFGLGFEAQIEKGEDVEQVRRDLLEWAVTDVERLLGNCGEGEEVRITVVAKPAEKPF